MQDLILSDRTFLPKGITITASGSQTSMDPEIYEAAEISDVSMDSASISRGRCWATEKNTNLWQQAKTL